MYHQYFGLREAPFSIAVNPRYLFMSPRHRDALAHLLYGVGAGGGFILLTGEVGTGKTTINRCLLEQLPDDTDIAIILNPALNALELLASVCDELGIDCDTRHHSLKSLTDKLHRFLLDNHARGRKTVLMIDEAQHLDFDVLEQIRLLTNLETNHEKLLQIVLIGQPELAAMLRRPELRQLNQRITARYDLGPLSLDETRAYIRHRLQVAGLTADRELFADGAVRAIHRRSRGIPRLINLLCDRSLLGAYGGNKSRADRAMVEAAAREVMGEEGASSKRRRPAWVVAALVGAVIAAAGAWLWNRGALAPRAEAPAVAAAAPARVAPEAPAANKGSTTAAPWLQPPDAAGQQLWALHAVAVAPDQACPLETVAGLACYRDAVRTWDALQGYDRPLVLELVTPERFRAAALLLGIEGQRARLAAGETVAVVPLAELTPLWSGEFYLLWQPPEGFDGPLSLGDEGPAVAAVARMLARLDGQDRPLTQGRFNEALQSRVRLFQASNQLAADGVVGVRTLLKLNEQLGIDITRSLALSQLETGERS
ncbi:AAA family ATPase [Parahaliea mediterranea]|uniref:AAA family ATPase n=1 Tax=Parahaliea mediterranea TaxID=651086 RepID=A0A939DDT5_9GAMM|nr:AAA family ATPase [Parahaliea mediterranea]MBN7796249.1 AAA family ATPase [Parahaliea mediterranea]